MDICKLTTFFMWSTIINAALLTLSTVILIIASDFVYRVHTRWFAMPRPTFNAIIYSFLGAFKIALIVFNIVPYLALLIIA